MTTSLADWVAVALLGGLVGASEIVSRYKDAPETALKTLPAIFYVAINAMASILALDFVHAYNLFAQARATQILVAGAGAMGLFRTSVFVVRAGDRDIGVGPSGFLQIFLAAADRAVDRIRGAQRSHAVADLMRGIDYAKAYVVLPPYCLALLQNVSPEDQQQLGRALQSLDRREVDGDVKSQLLGLELLNVVGIDVLRTAVESLGDQIRPAPGR